MRHFFTVTDQEIWLKMGLRLRVLMSFKSDGNLTILTIGQKPK